MPFDRLVRTVDEWAHARGNASQIFAQIGMSKYQPKAIKFARFLDPLEFRRRVDSASVIVAHAGMGSIITALEHGKPIVVMPRRAELNETRNDHQVATAVYLSRQHRLVVAFDEDQLLEKLDQLDSLPATERIGTCASPHLISAIRQFIEEGSKARAG